MKSLWGPSLFVPFASTVSQTVWRWNLSWYLRLGDFEYVKLFQLLQNDSSNNQLLPTEITKSYLSKYLAKPELNSLTIMLVNVTHESYSTKFQFSQDLKSWLHDMSGAAPAWQRLISYPITSSQASAECLSVKQIHLSCLATRERLRWSSLCGILHLSNQSLR